MTHRIKPYRDRPVHALGIKQINGWQFKCYEIVYPTTNALPKPHEWEYAFELVKENIQAYANAAEELKIGYLIYHRGDDTNYFVISRWSCENMLRMFSFRSSAQECETSFQLVQDGLNICVWDMLIHAHERNSYVKHILMNPDTIQRTNYLKDEYSNKV